MTPGGRHLAGEVEQGGGAVGGGLDADALQPVGDGRQGGSVGVLVGEQPRPGVGHSLADLDASGGDQRPEVAGETVRAARSGWRRG